ncbi:hypothetical protein [Microaerobacter geothermalis]|uniref:hypothetical protein n=1 Tax=Microaerobacter geothermalis TaxID=674972 RepID=UPI001F37407E|nr:hypothetical protein [Microaerobacter geothermalis]
MSIFEGMKVMNVTILSVKKQIDGKGVFYKILLFADGSLSTCFIRSELHRSDLLQKLYQIRRISDIYQIDEKATIYSA